MMDFVTGRYLWQQIQMWRGVKVKGKDATTTIAINTTSGTSHGTNCASSSSSSSSQPAPSAPSINDINDNNHDNDDYVLVDRHTPIDATDATTTTDDTRIATTPCDTTSAAAAVPLSVSS
jgi:hypothetical protein